MCTRSILCAAFIDINICSCDSFFCKSHNYAACHQNLHLFCFLSNILIVFFFLAESKKIIKTPNSCLTLKYQVLHQFNFFFLHPPVLIFWVRVCICECVFSLPVHILDRCCHSHRTWPWNGRLHRTLCCTWSTRPMASKKLAEDMIRPHCRTCCEDSGGRCSVCWMWLKIAKRHRKISVSFDRT